MTEQTIRTETRADCELRMATVDQQMRHLWWPGRRSQLVTECYEIGFITSKIGASDLAEKSFRTAVALVDGRRLWRTRGSLTTFGIVAACHNHLGLQYLDDRKFKDAVSSFDSAIELRKKLRRLFPKDRENEVYLGGALCNRGHASAEDDLDAAKDFYAQSLAVLRQPIQPCECSYWDEERQTWWCEQLEAIGQALNLQWVALAPRFIDNAQLGLRSLENKGSTM